VSNVNNLPDGHQQVLNKMVTLFRRHYSRWPTIMEIARSLKRSKQSIVNSMQYLERAKLIEITNYGPGIPPSISVKGYKVELKEEN